MTPSDLEDFCLAIVTRSHYTVQAVLKLPIQLRLALRS